MHGVKVGSTETFAEVFVFDHFARASILLHPPNIGSAPNVTNFQLFSSWKTQNYVQALSMALLSELVKCSLVAQLCG